MDVVSLIVAILGIIIGIVAIILSIIALNSKSSGPEGPTGPPGPPGQNGEIISAVNLTGPYIITGALIDQPAGETVVIDTLIPLRDWYNTGFSNIYPKTFTSTEVTFNPETGIFQFHQAGNYEIQAWGSYVSVAFSSVSGYVTNNLAIIINHDVDVLNNLSRNLLENPNVILGTDGSSFSPFEYAHQASNIYVSKIVENIPSNSFLTMVWALSGQLIIPTAGAGGQIGTLTNGGIIIRRCG